MPQAPEPEGSRLMDEAIRIYFNSERGVLNDIEFQRAKRSVDKLLRVDPTDAGALSARGILEATRNDEAAVRTFERIVAMYPRLTDARVNYLTVLSHFGYIDRALDQARQAWDMAPGNLQILDRVIRYAFVTGDLKSCRASLKQWHREKQERHVHESDIELAEAIAAEHPESDLQAIGDMVAIAVAVARERGFVPHVTNPQFHLDDERSWISIPVAVPADADALMDLSFAFADRVAETDIPDRVGSSAIVRFMDVADALREEKEIAHECDA